MVQPDVVGFLVLKYLTHKTPTPQTQHLVVQLAVFLCSKTPTPLPNLNISIISQMPLDIVAIVYYDINSK